MSMLIWIPPADLAERALGAEHGGGRPSWAREDRRHRDGRWVATGWHIVSLEDGPLGVAVTRARTALLLALDGEPCVLSVARAVAIGNAATKPHTAYGRALYDDWAVAENHAALAKWLVERVGGEIVEVP